MFSSKEHSSQEFTITTMSSEPPTKKRCLPTTTTTDQAANTVYFDVGGTKYKVSRSLLESFPDTMLARMASEYWTNPRHSGTEANPLFIERDGERFRLVLDYMRDGGSVSLPPSTFPRRRS